MELKSKYKPVKNSFHNQVALVAIICMSLQGQFKALHTKSSVKEDYFMDE